MINRHSYISRFWRKSITAILLFVLLGFNSSPVVLGQTNVPTPGQDFDGCDTDNTCPLLLDSRALTTLVSLQASFKLEPVAQHICDGPRHTTLIQQQAALRMESVGQNIEYHLRTDFTLPPDIFEHCYYPNAFVSDDIPLNFVEGVLQLARAEILKVHSEFKDFLRIFVAGKL